MNEVRPNIIRHQIAVGLSLVILFLMIAQAAIGLAFAGLYRDNAFVRSAWYGNDLVSLLIASPLLAGVLLWLRRHSTRAKFLLLGVLAYVFYNYAFYVFGAALNSFFLLYVALITLSAYALILGVSGFNIEELNAIRWSSVPIKPICSYMFLWGVFLSALWSLQSLNFAVTGTMPAIVTATAHPTNITAALDLSIMVPAVILGATLLWKRSPWGLLISIIMNGKGFLYALVLACGSFVASRGGIPEIASQIPLWLLLSAASLVCCVFLLKGVTETARTSMKKRR